MDCVITSTCIEHIFTNIRELCSRVLSVAVGCSDQMHVCEGDDAGISSGNGMDN